MRSSISRDGNECSKACVFYSQKFLKVRKTAKKKISLHDRSAYLRKLDVFYSVTFSGKMVQLHKHNSILCEKFQITRLDTCVITFSSVS